ncbi:MAG: metallopeptidase TldD-related protein [Elusimicrobia bacterium]|nr:metallopeptidase TldD-related protein [Elusimicrobiota bacterium]
MLRTILALLLSSLPAIAGAAQPADPVMDALSKELDRSFSGLKKAEKVPLYYLGYELTVSTYHQISAKLGALEYDGGSAGAKLDIDMRVNTMELDNTHQVKGSSAWGSYSQSQNLPVALDGDEDAIRARLWQYTDKAYKAAQEKFTKVKMNKAVTAEEDDPSPDFSAAPPEKFYETVTLKQPDLAAWRDRLKRLSARFEGYPFIYDSGVWLSWENQNRYLVNSDGTRVKTGNNYIVLGYSLMSRTTDGMDLTRGERYAGSDFSDLPSDDRIIADMDRSIKELKALLAAPVVDPYSGPAILNARAAAVYFHEIIGHRLEGHRQKQEDSGQTFAKKVGQKVTSDIITLYDDPAVRDFRGIPLRGYYRYDDEGVKARRAGLVDHGVLKGFLMSRSPIRGFSASNGHGRREAGNEVVSRMGNTIVEASTSVPYAQLRGMLIEECKKQGKPFGLVFDDISGGFTRTSRGSGQTFKVLPLLVYRVYTDGRPDEVVRGVDIVGTPLTSFSKIEAAADDPDVFNGTCGAESGWVPVSAVSPSLLLGEIEVEKSQKSQQKQPVLPPPTPEKGAK